MIIRNNSLDICKLIAAIGVILIHARFPGKVGEVVVSVFQFSVPFFFLIAGYYVCANRDLALIGRQMKRTLRIAIISCLIYILFNIITSLCVGGDDLVYKPFIIRFILLNDVDWICGALWFLFSLLYGYAFFYLFFKSFKINYHRIVTCIVLLLLVGRVIVFSLRPDNWHLYNNWIFSAIPFIGIGFIIREKQNKVRGIFPLAIIVLITQIMCSCMGLKIMSQVLSQLFAICIFWCCISYPINNINYMGSKVSEFGKNCNLYIYIIHPLIIMILSKLFGNNLNAIFPICVVILSCVTSYLISKTLDTLKNLMRR